MVNVPKKNTGFATNREFVMLVFNLRFFSRVPWSMVLQTPQKSFMLFSLLIVFLIIVVKIIDASFKDSRLKKKKKKLFGNIKLMQAGDDDDSKHVGILMKF